MNKLTAQERNEHYGRLNVRFDERAAILREMGYKYEQVPMLPVAVFTRQRFGKWHAIPACLLSCADEIVWEDKLEEAKRFCA